MSVERAYLPETLREFAKDYPGRALGRLLSEGADEIERGRAELDRAREALAFAASAIKCGEPWTPECDRIIGRAIRKTAIKS